MPEAQEPAPSAPPWRFLLGVAAVPALVAVVQLGRIHPDEVYQTLEPAFRRAFGYGIVAWEWQVGLRNWAIPELFSWILKACAALGVRHPIALRTALEVPQFLLHAWALLAAYRYVERRVGSEKARWAIPALGLYAPVIIFSGRTMGESFSTAFLLIALDALDRPARKAADSLLGGAMLGLSVVARYGSGVIVVAAMAWLLGARRFRTFLFAAAGGLAVAAALGALDWQTWGRPFHSLIAYLDFNLLSGQAEQQFGRAGASYYLGPLLEWAPLWAWPGVYLALARKRPRISLPLVCAVAYLVATSLVAHKEHRFIYPALVLLALAAAPEALEAIGRVRRPDLAGALTALLLVASAGPYLRPTELDAQRPEQFWAIVKATQADGATGLLIVNEGIWGAGGAFYVGKEIPWYTCDWPHDGAFQLAMADRRFNRAITYDGRALAELEMAGFEVIEQLGRETILQRR